MSLTLLSCLMPLYPFKACNHCAGGGPRWREHEQSVEHAAVYFPVSVQYHPLVKHGISLDSTWASVVQGVVSEVAQRFSKMATELLDTLRKTESSLKRIRQSRATDASAGGGPSDIDKISLQLFLDVQAG